MQHTKLTVSLIETLNLPLLSELSLKILGMLFLPGIECVNEDSQHTFDCPNDVYIPVASGSTSY